MPSKRRRKLDNHARTVANLSSLIKSAKGGNLQSQHDLAAFYATDDLFGLKDEVKAIRWYKMAAEKGHAESQYDLGFMLLLGEGTEKDVAAGVKWLEQVGEGGSASAALLLSDIYSQGMFGVAANQEKVEYWERKSGTSEGRI